MKKRKILMITTGIIVISAVIIINILGIVYE